MCCSDHSIDNSWCAHGTQHGWWSGCCTVLSMDGGLDGIVDGALDGAVDGTVDAALYSAWMLHCTQHGWWIGWHSGWCSGWCTCLLSRLLPSPQSRKCPRQSWPLLVSRITPSHPGRSTATALPSRSATLTHTHLVPHDIEDRHVGKERVEQYQHNGCGSQQHPPGLIQQMSVHLGISTSSHQYK